MDKLPRALIACVGGGSNSIGLFHSFIADPDVQLIGVEAGGRGDSLGEHAARFHRGGDSGGGQVGVLQGTMSYVLQDANGQIATTHSISAGLDYSAMDRSMHISMIADESNTYGRAMPSARRISTLRQAGRNHSRAQDVARHSACYGCCA